MKTRIDVHDDLQAESSWVPVQLTTCRGRGYIVAAALQATQLVRGALYTVKMLCSASSNTRLRGGDIIDTL